jgi:hypothetical protein
MECGHSACTVARGVTIAKQIPAKLTATGWKRWTGAIASREKEISFDWPAIREHLRDELKAWSEALQIHWENEGGLALIARAS